MTKITKFNQLDFRQTKFLLSAPNIYNMPTDEGLEIAFAGRSNAGKSSALNAITDQKNLARSSKTPGRTQLINIFQVNNHLSLIDLPGYGFAEVPLAVKQEWQKSLGEYMQQRKSMKGIVILMDIRHPLKPLDKQLIDWSLESNLNILILLTKADKLKRGAQKNQLLRVKNDLPKNKAINIVPFSALKKQGIEESINILNSWYDQYLSEEALHQ